MTWEAGSRGQRPEGVLGTGAADTSLEPSAHADTQSSEGNLGPCEVSGATGAIVGVRTGTVQDHLGMGTQGTRMKTETGQAPGRESPQSC